MPGLGVLDLGLSVFYSLLLLAVLALSYLSLSRRNRRD
jgi:hypothetical protein